MSKSNHTPGPWNVGRPQGACRDIPIYAETQCGFDHIKVRNGGSDAETAANAHLAAASPDLLKACQAAEDSLCRATFPGPRRQSDLNYAIDLCRAAIAKAKGGAE